MECPKCEAEDVNGLRSCTSSPPTNTHKRRAPPGGGGNFQSLLRRSERTGGIHHSLIIHMTGQGEKVLFREEGVELSLDDVYDAREIVSKHAKVTPVFTNSTIR